MIKIDIFLKEENGNLKWAIGFEPMTSSSAVECSTTEQYPNVWCGLITFKSKFGLVWFFGSCRSILWSNTSIKSVTEPNWHQGSITIQINLLYIYTSPIVSEVNVKYATILFRFPNKTDWTKTIVNLWVTTLLHQIWIFKSIFNLKISS